MICFDVSALVKAHLGATLTLDVNFGPQVLTDDSIEDPEALEVGFLHGSLQVVCVQDGLFVQGPLESQLELECARCLNSFVFPITLDLAETFRWAEVDQTPEMPYSISDNGELDLTSLLREQTWLTIPMKPLCCPDCKGLCPQCGVNLNIESCTCEDEEIDPRLAKLKELL